MRYMRIGILVTTLTLALASATASAQTITYDYDKAADFSKFKTYAWTPGINSLDEFNRKRIVTAIDAQLTAKGLTKVDSGGNADMLVAYQTRADRDLQINAWGWGGTPRSGNRNGSARTEEIVNGTIVVDVIDAKTEAMLWRGIARKELDTNASPEKRDREVSKAVEKLFKHFPPTKS